MERVLIRAALLALLLLTLCLTLATPARASNTAQAVPFSQNWSTTSQISSNNNWNNVPGINGYLGGDIPTSTFAPGSDPQGTVADGATTGLQVSANQTNPNTNTSGGVAEFQITNPTVALQPTDTADLPHLVMNLNTTGKKNVNVSYLLRDIDGSADNAAQQAALQYRVGSSGNYTNLPAGYVQDATTGPGLATKETKVNATLPAAVENQALVQVRVVSANAVGTDEWVGVDDIAVSSVPTVTLNSPPASANEGETKTYDFAATDPGQDTPSVRSGFPDCGTGGTFVSSSLQTGAAGGSFQCRFLDGPASPTVRMQTADEDGGNSNVATRSVTVVNVAPTVSLDGPTAADEGQTRSYTYGISDPGEDSNPTVAENCGQNGTKVDTPEPNDFGCRFPDGPSTTTVGVRVSDSDNADGNTATKDVAIRNVAPTVALTGPATADEGRTKAYSYSISDPGADPTPTVTEDCGPNGGKTDTPAADGFECRFPDGPATSTVVVSATDEDGAGDDDTVRVNVSNVAPYAAGDPAQGAYATDEDTGLSVAASPAVVKVSPTGRKATVKSVVTATLSEKLNAGTVNNANFSLIKKGTKRPVDAAVSYDPANDAVVLKPASKLARGHLYRNGNDRGQGSCR